MRTIPLLATFILTWAAGCQAPDPGRDRPAQARPTAPPGPQAAPATSLYERLGGAAAGEKNVTLVVDLFLGKVSADPVIKARFAGANIPRIRQGLIDLIGQAAGGPQRYKGGDMKTVHKGMGIGEEEWSALVADLVAALDQGGVGAREKGELLGAIGPLKKDIVEPKATTDERLARIEAQLARIERRLDSPPAVGTELNIVVRGGEFPKPPPGPPIPKQVWTADEKRLSKELVERYSMTANREPTTGGEPRADLIGQPLAQTRFLNSTGDVYDLADLRGKKVLLVILRGFAGQVCLHCSSQTLALATNIKKFKDRNTQVVLVYPGQAESVPAFVEAVKSLQEGFEPPFPIVLDTDLAAVRTFRIEGSLAKPTTLLLDELGIVRYAYVGRQPADRPSVEELLAVIDVLPARK